jgi:WD40 repeat protein
MIFVACSCGRNLRLKDELAGKKVRCPDCSQVLAVPPPAPADVPNGAVRNALPPERVAPSSRLPWLLLSGSVVAVLVIAVAGVVVAMVVLGQENAILDIRQGTAKDRQSGSTHSGERTKPWGDVPTVAAPLYEVRANGIVRIGFSPDNKWLAALAHVGGYSLWDPATGAARGSMTGDGFTDSFFPCIFTADSKAIVAASGTNVGLLEVPTGKVKILIKNASRPSPALSKDGTVRVVYNDARAGDWVLHNATANKEEARVKLKEPLRNSSVPWLLAPHLKKAVVNLHTQLWILKYDTATATKLSELLPGAGSIYSDLALSPTGPLAATAKVGNENKVELWDLETGQTRDSWEPPQGRVPLGVAFSPDGKWLAIALGPGRGEGANDCSLIIWSVSRKRVAAVLEGAPSTGRDPTFSEDMKRLAVVDLVRIYVWDLTQARLNGP